MNNIGQRIANTARAVRDYTRPRPTTGGDLAASSSASAALAGTFQGWISGGPVIATAGLLGGYVGVKAGEKMQGFLPAVSAGAITGAAVATTATVALSALMSAPLAGANLAAGAMLGAFAGAVGTLSGSRRASTRDGVYGGMILGAIGRAVTGNPLLTIAGAAGGGIGGKAPTVAGRLVLGALAGAATGAISGILGGPAVMIPSALVGAALGAGGAVVGPVARQVQRNMTEDLTRGLITRIDPYIQKHGISRWQKIALGATAGALTIGPLGLLFGLQGLAVTSAIGVTVGAISTWRVLHKRDQMRRQAEEAGAQQPATAAVPANASPDPVPAEPVPAAVAAAPSEAPAAAPHVEQPMFHAGDLVPVPASLDPQRDMYIPVPGDRVPDVRQMSSQEIAAAWAERRLAPIPTAPRGGQP